MKGRRFQIVLLLVAALLAAAVGACSPAGPTPIPVPAASGQAEGSAAPAASMSLAATQPPTTPSLAPTPSAEPLESMDPGPTQAPDAAYALLDGVKAPEDARLLLPVAIMVADNPQSRPQYGLNTASIVYQAPADGGETRYMMVYQEQAAKRIEPVRSGRPYFVNWASEYRSAFAHYGGDAKTLAYLPTINKKYIWDIDALFGSRAAFHRDKSRKAPQNAVTSTGAVRKMAIRKGASEVLPAGAPVRVFGDDLPADQRPAKGSIRIPYNRGTTSYTYDKAANRYLRSVAGKPQIDAADGKRVSARNVVVQFMKYSIDPESEPGYHRPVFGHIGSGRVLVFRDGHVIKGTWKKPSAHALTRFYDEAGKEISLVRGPIFIQVEPLGAKVTYAATPVS